MKTAIKIKSWTLKFKKVKINPVEEVKKRVKRIERVTKKYFGCFKARKGYTKMCSS